MLSFSQIPRKKIVYKQIKLACNTMHDVYINEKFITKKGEHQSIHISTSPSVKRAAALSYLLYVHSFYQFRRHCVDK